MKKYLIVIGGFIGFTLCFISGIYSGNDITLVIRNASIASVVSAILMKVFIKIVEFNMHVARMENMEKMKKDIEDKRTEKDLENNES